jgi:hypothetical protein
VALIILLDAQVRSFQMAMAWCMMALRVTAHFEIYSKIQRANAREVGLFIAAFILKRKGRWEKKKEAKRRKIGGERERR